MPLIKDKIAALHRQYDVLQQSISAEDWLRCQQDLQECQSQFEALFKAEDTELIDCIDELTRLRERHLEVLHAVKKVRDNLSVQIGKVRKGRQVQETYTETYAL